MAKLSLTRRDLFLAALVGTATLGVARPSLAKDPNYFADFWGNAIRGYDPVAYFTEGKAVEGSEDLELDWDGATWRFASAENLAAFKADPTKYAPQFGGYCAWAVSQGYTASIDPEAWDIVNGKLYLNYSTGIQKKWQQNRDANIAAGERNWPAALGS
ncbi:MAG: YHS domain-containing (seleno)protein [Rhodospirillaceae bacterium]